MIILIMIWYKNIYAIKITCYKVVSIKFEYGISPVFELPVAGWLDYQYHVIETK